eukprot:3383832-Prymnesium_polylepis.1
MRAHTHAHARSGGTAAKSCDESSPSAFGVLGQEEVTDDGIVVLSPRETAELAEAPLDEDPQNTLTRVLGVWMPAETDFPMRAVAAIGRAF